MNTFFGIINVYNLIIRQLERISTESTEQFTLSPEDAKLRLEGMGFFERKWEKIMTEGFGGGIKKLGSHEVRALITIARGSEPQVLEHVYLELRKEEEYSDE